MDNKNLNEDSKKFTVNFDKDEEALKRMPSNGISGINEVSNLENEKIKELIENIKNDRKLKTRTLKFVQKIIMSNIITTMVLLIGYPIIYLVFDKKIYSEKFLGFLTGSQLIVMPLAILQIITKHLFPNKKDDEK